jgi:hypothetical protein
MPITQKPKARPAAAVRSVPDQPCAIATETPRLPAWLTAALRRQAEHGCASARPPHQTAALLYETEERASGHISGPKR